MRLSIVIPVFNQWPFTKHCLKCLFNLSEEYEIIVVDDCSTDDTQDELNKITTRSNFRIIRNETNSGFAKTVNKGYAVSAGDYVLFLNNDIKVNGKEDWPKKLIEAAEDGSIVGPTVGVLDKKLNFVTELNYIPNVVGHFYISGWNITAKRETWEKLKINNYTGPFTEEFVTYYEDSDLGIRAKQLEIPLKVIDVPVVHIGKVSTKAFSLKRLYFPAKEKFIKKWASIL